MSFRPRADHKLNELTDEQLLAYIRDARSAGQLPAGRRALAFLVFGYERDVKRRLRIRVPEHVVDDPAHDVLVKTIAAAFEGVPDARYGVIWIEDTEPQATPGQRFEHRPDAHIAPYLGD